RKKNTTATAETEDVRRARKSVRHMMKYWPLTVADQIELERDDQERRVKMVCRAFKEEGPNFMRIAGLDEWVRWALGPNTRDGLKDNQVRDKTLAVMVEAVLLRTELRPTRNQARQSAQYSACSIIVEVLSEKGVNLSEAVVENAWKAHVRAHP